MIICILNKETKKVINRLVVDSADDYNLKDNEELSDNHDGQIGWTRSNGEWVEPVVEDTRTYVEKRASEYPDFREYLDGIVKNDQAQIDQYIADCQAVKDKYPKE